MNNHRTLVRTIQIVTRQTTKQTETLHNKGPLQRFFFLESRQYIHPLNTQLSIPETKSTKMALHAFGQCLSLSLLLAASAFTDLKVPLNYDIPLDNATTITLRELTCPLINGGQTGVYYNTSGLSIEVFQPMNITCEMQIEVNHTKSTTLVFGLTSKQGEALTIATDEDPARACFSANATLSTCTLAPAISDLRFSPPDATLDFILAIIGGFVNGEIKKMICGLGEGIVGHLTNATMNPQNSFPKFRMGAMSVQQWPVTEMITNIVARIPYSFYGAHIDVTEPSRTGLGVNITMLEPINISTPNFTLYTPPDVRLEADLGFDMLICRDAGWECIVSNGIKLPNLRTFGGGQTDRLVNKVLSPLLSSLLDILFAKGVAMNIPEGESFEAPPLIMIILLGPLMAVLAVACVGFSVFRHSKHPVCDISGKALSIRRVIFEDVFITGTCFTCIYLFAWSNATTAASVVVGDKLTVYTFSLVNSVEDMWKAGLYPLSILIAIFSGVYPYVKLLTIVTFSVILQQPQNKFLRLIDNIGKFSLLDSFVMTILKTGLEINGIATVKSHFGFYVFVFATIGSMLIGNYATHGWRRQTTIRYNDDERELLVQRASASNRLKKDSPSGVSSPPSTYRNSTPHIGLGYSANDGAGAHFHQHQNQAPALSGNFTARPIVPVAPANGLAAPLYGGPMSGDDDDYLTSPNSSSNGAPSKLPVGADLDKPPRSAKSKFDSAVRRHLISDKGIEGIEAMPSLRWYEVWEWQLAVPLGVLMAVISGVACYYPSITYYISGIATALTGAEKPMSLWDLFIACDPILLSVGLFTVIFAPITYVATYPHARFLAAWGATDVFLLSCVAGLLQLKQFIDFTLGEGMEFLYSASCKLQWPLGLWALSVFVQWFFTFKQTLGIPGVPTLTKIKLALALRDTDSSIGDYSPR